MKRTTLRASATTALAAVAFAIGAPAASAVEYHRSEARAAATVQTGQPALSADEARALLAAPELRGELAPAARADMQAVADGTATQRQQRASAASAGKALWNLIKKAGPSIAKAAKKVAGKYQRPCLIQPDQDRLESRGL